MKIANKGAKVTGLVIFAAVCIGIFVYLFGAAGGKVRLHSPYQFTVTVDNAFQLVPNADVRQAGVKIGSVDSIDYDDQNRGVVKMELKKDYAPIYKDASIQVRTKTLVGENYIDLNPGTPAAGKLPTNAKLDLGHDDQATQLDQILSTLDPATRASVQANLRNLGVGFGGHADDLNRLFGAVDPTVTDGEDVMSVLVRQRQALARLVGNTGDVLGAIGRRSADVAALARGAKTTAIAAASRDAAMAQALRELPATLDQARLTTLHLGAFGVQATPVIHNLRLAARDLGPVVQDLQPTATSGRALIAALPSFVKQTDPLLSNLRTFTSAARPTVPALQRLLNQATPALRYLSNHRADIGAFFATVGSGNNTRDAVGQIGRVMAVIDQASVGALQPAEKQALDLLLNSGLVKQFNNIGLNPYPAAGQIGNPQPFTGAYPRVRKHK